MADPRRYDVYAVLKKGDGEAEASMSYTACKSGDWVKWHDFKDYKSAQRRNKTEGLNIQLGVEIAVLRGRLSDLAAENERLRSASFVTAVPSEEYEKLKSENERLRKAGDEMMEVLESEIPFTAMNAVTGWLAAKEGGDK